MKAKRFPPSNLCNMPAAPLQTGLGDSRKGKLKSVIKKFCNQYNGEVKLRCERLSLSSSNLEFMGGTSGADTSLSGTFKRYFQERLSHPLGRFGWCDDETARLCGVISKHRVMRQYASNLNSSTLNDLSSAAYVLDSNDYAMLTAISKDIYSLEQQLRSMNGILAHLENLGHEKVDFVEGLNVELLDFQRQTLKWAVERELVPGGIQSYFWPELPVSKRDGGDIVLYFNPILNRFRMEKPCLVRGGFIADEMGLGKVIFSISSWFARSSSICPLITF